MAEHNGRNTVHRRHNRPIDADLSLIYRRITVDSNWKNPDPYDDVNERETKTYILRDR